MYLGFGVEFSHGFVSVFFLSCAFLPFSLRSPRRKKSQTGKKTKRELVSFKIAGSSSSSQPKDFPSEPLQGDLEKEKEQDQPKDFPTELLQGGEEKEKEQDLPKDFPYTTGTVPEAKSGELAFVEPEVSRQRGLLSGPDCFKVPLAKKTKLKKKASPARGNPTPHSQVIVTFFFFLWI